MVQEMLDMENIEANPWGSKQLKQTKNPNYNRSCK
jgi:hypothetical protein